MWTKERSLYLMQRCADGFVVRYFTASLIYRPGKYETPELRCQEERRALYDPLGHPLRAYFWGLYRQRNQRWIACGPCPPNWWGATWGRVYGRTLYDLAKRGLSRTGLLEYIKWKGVVDPEKYLAVLNEVPQLEQLCKAGLGKLTDECMSDYHKIQNCIASGDATSLTKMLGINTPELKRLRANHGGTKYLVWLQYEKASGRAIPDDVIFWFCGENVLPNDLKFIRDRMNMVQICHYMKRQLKDRHYRGTQHMLTTWADYLSMATRFHLDVNNEIVYRAGNLRQRHDELVERSNDDKDISVRIGKIMLEHPKVEDILRSMKDKYAYDGEQYRVVVPTSVEDIILEGNYLHHCVANADRYWDRMEQGVKILDDFWCVGVGDVDSIWAHSV